MKKLLPVLTALALAAASLTGCSKNNSGNAAETPTSSQAETAVSEIPSTEVAEPSSEEADTQADETADTGAIRIGSLKGPTSMGLVSLMNSESSANQYDFTMVTAADELTASIVSGKLDIALVPANVASILYNKTKGGISVIDINTLGVLYLVSADSSVTDFHSLKGKTIYLTGKGTTPDYVFQYLLKENGMSADDVTMEYKSEPTEVAAILKEKENAIGLLPQPFVTVACAQNEALNIALDLTAEWDKLQGGNGSRLVTGVTIVTNSFLKEHNEKIKVFMADHQVSAENAEKNPDETAELIVKAGIIEKAPIAKQALPYCNITYIDGEEMQSALSGYLNVLFEQDPASVGGTLPGDDFYYHE